MNTENCKWCYLLGSAEQGAINIVDQVLALRPGENLVVITDQYKCDLMEPVVKAARERLGAGAVKMFYLEELGERCLEKNISLVPDATLKSAAFKAMMSDLSKAKTGIFAGFSMGKEVAIRNELRKYGTANQGRFLHLPNMTQEMLQMGFCADQRAMHEYTLGLLKLARKVKWAHVTSLFGSNIWVALGYNWIALSSIIEPGQWANIGAEVFTCPVAIDGTWVGNGSMGDVFTRYGLLEDCPLELKLKNGIIQETDCSDSKLLEHYNKYAGSDHFNNGFRIGEFALPANPELSRLGLTGVNMQDEKALTHLASGSPRADETMGNIAPERFWWQSHTHVDISSKQTTVSFYNNDNDKVTVIESDLPTDFVLERMPIYGEKLRERLEIIKQHININNRLPVEQRQRIIKF